MIDTKVSILIKFLRFPLMIMVIMIHAHVTEISMGGVTYDFDLHDFPLYNNISYCISDIVCRIAVPIFYIFSGYLFYINIQDYTVKEYVQKIRKRTKTLIVPYFFWNLAVIFFFFLAQTLMPSFTSGVNKLVVDYSFYDWIRCFWDSHNGMPICYQLWFIRDLFVVVLLSFVIYYAIKKCKFYYLLSLGLLYLVGVDFRINGLSVVAIFFFSIGALFSIYKYDFIEFLKRFKTINYIISLLLIILQMIMFNNKDILSISTCCGNLICNFCVLSMIVSFLNILLTIQEKRGLRVNAFLHDSNFFIYVFHAMPLALIIKLSSRFILPTFDMPIIFIYFMAPLLTIALGLVVFAIMRKMLPRFTELITGSRV